MTSSPDRTRTHTPFWMRSFGLQITLALILGLLLGLVARMTTAAHADPLDNPLTLTLTTIGDSYVSLLKTTVVPLIFTAIISSIGNLKHVSGAARLAGRTLLWFAFTAFIAVTIGLILGSIIQPGNHAVPLEATPKAPASVGNWWSFLTGLIPTNIFGLNVNTTILPDGNAASSSVTFDILQIIVISTVIGIAAVKSGKRAEPFLHLIDSLLRIIQKILWWIIRLAPIGTAALIGNAVARYGWGALGSLGWFVGTVYLGLILVFFVVYPTIIRLNGLSVRQFFSGVWPAVQMGFVTRSSLGTLPLTQRVTERNLGVPSAYASFATPLGATTKMDGCGAIYPAVATLFVAQFYDIALTPLDYILIIIVSVVGSAATAGTTGAIVMLTLTLTTVGLPLEGVGLLLAVDAIVDMGRTAVNVAGQALVPTVVAAQEKILDHDLYNAPRTRDAFTENEEKEKPSKIVSNQ